MSVYDHRCSGCQTCPTCGRSAWCEEDRILVIPCEHHGYCGYCNVTECEECREEVEADMEFIGNALNRAFENVSGDPFRQDSDDPDPWNVDPAEPHKPYNAAYHQAHKDKP